MVEEVGYPRHLYPDVKPSAWVRKVGLVPGHSTVPSADCMVKIERMGPSHALCRAPIELPTDVFPSPIFTLITAPAWNRRSMLNEVARHAVLPQHLQQNPPVHSAERPDQVYEHAVRLEAVLLALLQLANDPARFRRL